MQIGNSQWKTLIYNQYFIKYSYFSRNMKRETATFYFQAHFCTYKKLEKIVLIVLIIITKYVNVFLLHQLPFNKVKKEEKKILQW